MYMHIHATTFRLLREFYKSMKKKTIIFPFETMRRKRATRCYTYTLQTHDHRRKEAST